VTTNGHKYFPLNILHYSLLNNAFSASADDGVANQVNYSVKVMTNARQMKWLSSFMLYCF